MENVDALKILQRSLGYTESGARQVLADVNIHLREKGKTLECYPTTWFPGILAEAGEIGKVRLGELVRSDFAPEQSREELDALLAEAFPLAIVNLVEVKSS
jgi:hypothetical protein